MVESIRDNIHSWVDNGKVLKAVEKFLNSRWFLAALAIFIFVEQALGLDLVGFSVCAGIFVYICLFCKNTNATIPIFCMVTFCVSSKNSPAKNASGFHLLGKCDYYVGPASDFYASPEFVFTVAILAAMVLTAIAFRVVVFGDFKRAFSLKGMLIGVTLMSIGFALAGTTEGENNSGFLFGLVQAATFFFVYFFYASTLDFEKFSFDYIADVMLTIMFYIIALIIYIYATRFYGFLILSAHWKAMLFCGWGMSLDFGAYLAMTMPACFYKMLRSTKLRLLWMVFAVMAVASIYFTLARGAMVAACIEFLGGLIISLKEKDLRKPIALVLLSTLAALAALLFVLWKTNTAEFFFDYFIKKGESGDITSGRLSIWDRYFDYFRQNPIFGSGFAIDLEFRVSQVGNTNNGIFSIYSYLAHNLILQSIGSCGIVGTVTLGIHLLSILKTFITKADIGRGFLFLAVLGFLGMSLLDTIFYKAQFTFLYLALLVACEADVFRKEKALAALEKKQKQLRPMDENGKPRVVFAFVEAGMGHIMPMQALADAFEKKYGAYCDVIRSKFFNETGNKSLMALEQSFVKEVKKYNHSWLYGYFNMFMMEVLGTKFLSKIIMDAYVPGARIAAREHISELEPDMLVSTHWSTNYYAERMPKHKPLTVTYIPDVQTIPLFRYPCDMTLMSAKRGYDKAIKKYKRRYNEDNIRLVSFAIRNEAFAISMDKRENRRALGLDENKLTVVLFEGGYGLGKMGKITRLLVEKELPVNIVAICGRNEKLYNTLKRLQTKGNTTLIVEGFCDKTLQYLAAADVFLGKAGASSVAEATFFGTALIITKYATSMEQDNAEYYLKDVQNALRIFNPKKVVERLESWLANPKELMILQNNALQYHDAFGSEKSADVLWEMLCKQFPSLQNNAKQNGEKALESRVKKGLSKKEGKGKSRVKNAM